jgi:hypothetical protein
MKSSEFLRELGGIDDRYFEEAAKTERRRRLPRLLPFAAAFCLALAALGVWQWGLNWVQPSNIQTADYSNLPKLSVNTEFGGMGFEGYAAHDIDELIIGSYPWTEDVVLATLPVFKRAYDYERDVFTNALTPEQMLEKASEIVVALGYTVDRLYTNPTEEQIEQIKNGIEKNAAFDGGLSEEEFAEELARQSVIYAAVAECRDVKVTVDITGAVEVWFGIPDQPDKFDSVTSETMGYLLDKYAALVDMQSPKISVYGDYNIYGERNLRYMAFENSGDLTQRILGFNFNRVQFIPDDDGLLWIIDRYKEDLSQKIGDYPIITASEARQLLLEKRFITTVSDEFPGEGYVAGVELIYRRDPLDKVFMPYYRFFVELPEYAAVFEGDAALKNFKMFGAYYVPAVAEEFLTNLPVWNGGFN